MKKNVIKFSGIAVLFLGVVLVIVSLYTNLFLLIYGIPLFIIGLVIILNDKEDRIEQIVYKKEVKKKK